MPSLRHPGYLEYGSAEMMLQSSAPSFARPATASPGESSLEVVVVHTTTKATLQNLKTAAELAAGLGAHIRLLVLEVVPYPLAVESPSVPLEFTRRRFRTVAAGARIDTQVDIRLGRERIQMLEAALKPGSVIVLEGGGWWTRKGRLAKRLERLGHQVVLAG
jgi:hypothetical protein